MVLKVLMKKPVDIGRVNKIRTMHFKSLNFGADKLLIFNSIPSTESPRTTTDCFPGAHSNQRTNIQTTCRPEGTVSRLFVCLFVCFINYPQGWSWKDHKMRNISCTKLVCRNLLNLWSH